MINHFEDNYKELWKDWYTFGSHVQIPTTRANFFQFPSKEQWEEKVIKDTKDKYCLEMSNIFYKTTEKYCKDLKIDLPEWFFDSCDIAKYYEKSGISETKAMSYHTDYEQAKHQEPGNKFAVTCLFYLNDNYEGGEISFRIFNEDHSVLLESIEYKPSEGDVVIFPSGDPRYMKKDNFYHGVKIVDSGSKYLIRTYWKYGYEGDPKYFEEKQKYSDEDWETVLKARRKTIWQDFANKSNEEYE
jgi:hypothetical protein